MLKNNALAILLFFPLFIHAQEMWINEIHYDNTGGDVDEFVEVVLEDTFAGSLSDIEIVFYNGSNSSVISQSEPRLLSTFVEGDNSNGFTIYSRIFSSIQNGSPDGIALINNGTVVEFISYEGVLTAVGGPADGETSVDIGVTEPGAIGQSLQMMGTGNKANLFTWQPPALNTMGSVNNGQIFGDAFPRVVSVFPPDGTNGVDTAIPLDIVFSEPVNVTPASFSIACPTGPSTMSGFDLTQVDNTHYILTPNNGGFLLWPGNDTCTVTMIAVEITDLDGDNKPLDGNSDGTGPDDFTFSFNTSTDFLPRVDSVTPADGEILVAENSSITIDFTENVTLSTVSAITLNCQGNVPISGLPASNVSSVTITPINPFNQGDICTVTLVANLINDIGGGGLSSDPLDGNGDGIPGDNFQFGFSVIEPVMPIYDIQGSGNASPIEDSFIRTENNIVTALRNNGFFMQSPDLGDNDDQTSDGLFVFSNTPVQEGDSVNVRGQVIEFFGLTELTNVSSVVINSSGNTLPLEIIFDANTPSQDPTTPTCTSGEFECYEGMLVSVANGVANGGTEYSGEFPATATGERAIRGAGIEFSQTGDSQLPAFPTASYDPDIFDENPELFEVDTNGLAGMPIIDINGGSTFTASGVLSFSFGSYTLLPKTITTVNKAFDAIDTPGATEVTIATQNMFRFFDDIDDPAINDFQEDTTTPARFAERVNKASLYFRTIMLAPDVIVLTEIENIVAVQAIADKIFDDDNTLTYSAHLTEGQDFGGIDVGFLVKSTVSNITITQLGKDETIAFDPPTPPNLPRPLHDRPPLLLNGIVSKGGFSREINVLGLHLRSRSGITGSDRERIRNKHFEQSISVANMVQDLQSSTAALVVIGDFNDFEFSDGYADVVGEIKGVVDPIKNLLSSNGGSIVNPTLINAVDTLAFEEKYSFIFRGTIQALEHALVNDIGLALLSKTTFVRGNTDAPERFEDDYMQTLNMSDHDGLMIYLELNTVLESIFIDGFEE